MKLADRSLSDLCLAPLRKRNYIAAKNMLTLYSDPFDAGKRYLAGLGDYPVSITVNTPCGPIQLRLHSHHDLLTVNEIFCREDYRADGRENIIVDFGSNIGISAAYFLSRNTTSFAYLFEPVPRNIDKLKANLKGFAGRYQLSQVAVALEPGVFTFGCEETGRYGGIGKVTENMIQVEAVSSNDVIRTILSKHGRIDILKVDIETLEKEVITALPQDLVECIRTCYVEYPFLSNPLSRTHEMRRYGGVAQFRSLIAHG
jgi:FkbM family methyltransferase